MAANALAVTIRPPFEQRAKVATARSISSASRTSTGLTSTPTDGATAWMTGELADPGAYGGISKDRRSRHAGAICLSSSSHFPLKLYSKWQNR